MKKHLITVLGLGLLSISCANSDFAAQYSDAARVARLEWVECGYKYIDAQKSSKNKYSVFNSISSEAFAACKKQEDKYAKIAKLRDTDISMQKIMLSQQYDLRDATNRAF